MARSTGKSQRLKMSRGELIVLFFQNNIQIIGGIFAVLFAGLWVYPDYPNTSFLQGLNQISVHQSNSSTKYIAIGWNTNVDVIVNGVELLNACQAKIKSNSKISPKDFEAIDSFDQLQQTFAYYFEKSAAAERHVSDETLFNLIVSTATEMASATAFRTGGNAALMAQEMAVQGHQVLLGGPVGIKLAKLLHSNITQVTSSEQYFDEMHLILEYEKDATWNGLTAHRANRFIITRDTQNAKLTGMDALSTQMLESKEKPDALVVSGFHLLQAQDPKLRKTLLDQSKEAFQSTLDTIPIHLEFASISDLKVNKQIAGGVFPYVDSLGLNELELSTLSTALGQKTNPQLSQKVPVVDTVAQALSLLFEKYSTFANAISKHSSKRGLQRIHFHSLSYHIIAEILETEENARTNKYAKKSLNDAKKPSWVNAEAAVARGSLITSLRACNKSLETMGEYDVDFHAPVDIYVNSTFGMRTLTTNAVEPVAKWTQPLVFDGFVTTVQFHYVPVLVCKKPVQTVGLGDAISSSALLVSLPVPEE